VGLGKQTKKTKACTKQQKHRR